MAMPAAIGMLVIPGSMSVRMRGIMVLLPIRAAFRIEWRLHMAHMRTQSLQHIHDHVIIANKDMGGVNFCRQVTIAQMPRQPGKRLRIGRGYLHQRFGRRDHFHKAAAFQREPRAMIQNPRLRQIQQEIEAGVTGKTDTAAEAVVMRQGYAVAPLILRPLTRRHNPGGALHGQNRK